MPIVGDTAAVTDQPGRSPPVLARFAINGWHRSRRSLPLPVAAHCIRRDLMECRPGRPSLRASARFYLSEPQGPQDH